VINKIKIFLTHPLVRDLDLDSPETVDRVSKIIQSKPFLRQIYNQWYLSISNALPTNITGPVLELGSGGGFLKKYIPNLITSEILQTPGVDVVLDGQRLPFQNQSLRGIVMLDVLHHLPDSKQFFKDASLCVQTGGAIVMIEPWVTPWSKFVYNNLHHEPFDADVEEWKFPRGGPLSQANSALPWIIFFRDRSIFENKHPEWKIQDVSLHTPFAYLLSGGVSMRSLMPGFFYNIFRLLAEISKPCMKKCAMFATIVLQRSET
jgi:hypothetical protein